MKSMDKMTSQFHKNTELTGFVLPGMPLLELSGDQRVLLENHCGITCYSHREIRIKVKFGQLCVSGCNLELMQMTSSQLVITGNITTIQVFRGKEE